MIKLPDDAQILKYREVAPFDWQPIYKSLRYNFVGTLKDFMKKGYAYYTNIGFERRTLTFLS